MGNSIHPLPNVISIHFEKKALSRVVIRGFSEVASLTPTDASHVLDLTDVWDKVAALKALKLFSRQSTRHRFKIYIDPTELAQNIIDQLTHQTALSVLATAFCAVSYDFGNKPMVLVKLNIM